MSAATPVIANSLQELLPWRDQWDALAEAQGLPLAKFDWLLAAETHLAEPGCVRIVHVLDTRQTLAAAAALELREDRTGTGEYHLLGMPRLYEPATILYRDTASRARLLRGLAALGRPVVLARLWPDGTGGQPSGNGCRLTRHALEFHRRAAPSQYLDLTQGYAEYIDSLPSQRRYDLRRAYRRAEAAGPVRVEFARPSPDGIDALLDVALAVESRSWKGSNGSDVLANEDLRRFFTDALRRFSARDSVLIGLLRLGGTPAAAQICLVDHGRLWLLKIGYDQAFHKASPGQILMNETIRYAYDSGLAGIEFLGSAEKWVEAWRPEIRQYRLLISYPYTAASLMCLGREASGRLLRHAGRSGDAISRTAGRC